MKRNIAYICGVLMCLFVIWYSGVYNKSAEVSPIAPVMEELEVEEVVSSHGQDIVGYSVEGRPIEVFTFGTGENNVLFVGGIHGGYEWNSVLLAYEFVDYFLVNPLSIPPSVTVHIIPSANPDGVFEVIGKEGRFAVSDVPSDIDMSVGRFNANGVDLNRNFDCKWKEESVWRGKVVSAGTSAFSESESSALRDYVLMHTPKASVFWHSQANAVYGSECTDGILPETLVLLNAYANAAEYTAVPIFDAYEVTGDVEGWLASIGIPAITVELKNHQDTEWGRNQKGVQAVLNMYAN